jgi:hypothetical protein
VLVLQKIIFNAIFFSLSFSAGAAEIDAATIELVTNKYVALLAPRVKTLDRELIGFRYDTGSSKFDETNFLQIQKWMNARTARFFDPKDNVGDMVGAGLYLAVDPGASRSFGTTDPKLSVIKLKVKTRLLDVASSATKEEGLAYQEILALTSCSDSGPNNTVDVSFQSSIGYFRNSKKPECVKIAIDAITRIQAQGILYSYSGAHLSGCRSRSFAINLVDSSAMQYLAFFSDKVQHDPFGMASVVMSSYNEALNDFQTSFSLNSDMEPIPASLLNASESLNYSDWKSQFLLHCGAKWPTESGAVDFNSIMMDSFSKYTELRKLMVQNKRAYNKLYKNLSNFDIGRVKVYEKLAYEKSNLSATLDKYEQWTSVKDNLFISMNNLKVVGEILEEAEPVNPNMSDLLVQLDAELAKVNNQSVDIVQLEYDLFIKAGYGPRYAQLMINASSAYYGGPIMFVDNQKYIEKLQYCLSVYSDPKATPESVNKTDCAVRTPQNK